MKYLFNNTYAKELLPVSGFWVHSCAVHFYQATTFWTALSQKIKAFHVSGPRGSNSLS